MVRAQLTVTKSSIVCAGFGAGCVGLSRAVIALSVLMVRVQEAVPEQSPCQPANTDPPPAVAVRMTVEPPAKLARQVWPQLIPDGLLVTLPDPWLATVSRCVTGEALNRAVIALSVLMVRVQEAVPEQSPCQPANTDPRQR